jgi:6-phosphogluconolactonase (cycloisomerase 2 family)
MAHFLVGSFSDKLQLLDYDGAHLKLHTVDTPAFANFTWIVPHATRTDLFYGLQDLPGEEGAAHFFKWDGERLTFKDEISTGGSDPCHCCLGPDELMIANVCKCF